MLNDEQTPLLAEQPQDAPKSNEVPGATDTESQKADKQVGKLGVILPALAIGIFLAAMDNTIVVSTYGAIGSDMNELNRTSWIATAYLLTTTSFQPLYGKLSDIFGRKPALLFGYTIFGLGCLGCGLARSMNELIAARAFAGIGGGGMTTVVSIMLSDIVPLRSRGTWQGIMNIIFASGAAAGAPLGGLLADSIGWRWAFIGQFPACLLAITTVSLALDMPSDYSETRFRTQLKRVDFLGAFVLVVAVLTLLIGLDRSGNVSLTDVYTISFLCVSFVMFLLFMIVEHRLAAEPFAPGHIISERTILSCCLSNMFSFGGYMSILFYLPLYYQVIFSLSAGAAGLRILPAIIGGVVGSLSGGIFMQKTGRYYHLTVVAYSLLFFGSIPVLLFTGPLGNSAIGISIGLATIGFSLGIGVTSTLIGLIAAAGSKDQAVGTAASYLFRSLGTVLGVGVSSMLFQGNLRRGLMERLDGDDVDEIVRKVRQSLKIIDELSPATREIVISCYEKAVNSAFIFASLLMACAIVSCVFIKELKLSR